MSADSHTAKALAVTVALAWACAWPAPAPAQTDCFAVTRALREQGLPPAAAESTDCWYTIHVHAVRVTDCCPADRATPIDPGQVARWIEKANQVYAAARVRFEFDPTPGKGDWAEWNETDVNRLVAVRPGDPVWERAKAAANEMASHYPDKVLVLFRHGPGSGPVGGGFSSNEYDFVVMPAFEHTTGCGVQNINLFAHELGHYLGLRHTFREFQTVAEAERALTRAKRDPRVFDGDGIEDTSPDPYIEELACGARRSVVLSGLPFLLQRDNVMSYYYSEAKTITAQQAAIVRATIERRFAHTRDGTGPYAPDPRRTYKIVSLEDDTLLDAAPAAAGTIAGVVRAAFSGAASQTWTAIPLAAQDRGWFEIVSPATGRCLTVVAGGAPDGAALVLADWIGADNQKWRLAQDAHGGLFLEAKHSRRVLTASTGSVRAGAGTRGGAGRVEAAVDAGAPNQRWRMLPAD